MKTLKFTKELSQLILQGNKNTTWRLFDDKDLKKGDEVIFIIKETMQEFAKARLLAVCETSFTQMSNDGW